MINTSATIRDFGMDTRSMSGSLRDRLAAARDAGFEQISLCAADLVGHPDGLPAALKLVSDSQLRVVCLQALSDFEGLEGNLHDYKVGIAKVMLEMCSSVKCRVLVVKASTLSESSRDTGKLIRDLRQLAMLAIPKGIQIAFQSAPLSHAIMNYGSAWDLLCQADMPNLGLCLDALDALTNHEPNDELDMLDPDMIFLVQLADRMAKSVADQRVFPGEGEHSTTLANMVTVLHRLGYRGDYNLAVWHDDSNQIPAFQVAQRAQQAALWLGQDVLHRSVPLPNQIRLKRKKVV